MSLHSWKRSDSTAPLLCWNFTASLSDTSFGIQCAVFFVQVCKRFGLLSFLSSNSLQGSIRSACRLVSKHILPMACIAQLSTLLCRIVDISYNSSLKQLWVNWFVEFFCLIICHIKAGCFIFLAVASTVVLTT